MRRGGNANPHISALRCDAQVVYIDQSVVFLVDKSGSVSVTNDAEAVSAWAHFTHPGKRVVYRDSMGVWDEIIQREGVFLNFVRWKGEVPQ